DAALLRRGDDRRLLRRPRYRPRLGERTRRDHGGRQYQRPEYQPASAHRVSWIECRNAGILPPGGDLRRPGRATIAAMSYEHNSASFAWNASSFKDPSDYLLELSSDDRGELLSTVESLGRNA